MDLLDQIAGSSGAVSTPNADLLDIVAESPNSTQLRIRGRKPLVFVNPLEQTPIPVIAPSTEIISPSESVLRKFSPEKLQAALTTSPLNYLPESERAVMTPTRFLEESAAKQPESGFLQASAGIAKGLGGATDFITSPEGIALLGTGNLSPALRQGIAAAFSTQMASQTPEIAQQLGEEFAKPEGERDLKKIYQLITEGGFNTIFSALSGKEAIQPRWTAKPTTIEPETTEVQNATTEGQQPVNATAELPRVPPRQNIPAHPEEIRQGEGQRATGGGGTEPSPQVQAGAAPQQGLQPGVSPDIQQFEDIFTGKVTGPKIDTPLAINYGLKAQSVSDLDALAGLRRDATAKGQQLLEAYQKETDPIKKQQLLESRLASMTAQIPREAIEVATNTGSHVEGEGEIIPTTHGPRPLDWRTHPEVADWLVKNADSLGIQLPDELANAPVKKPLLEAAIRLDDGRTLVSNGNSHEHIMHGTSGDLRDEVVMARANPENEGFVDQNGKWYSRDKAGKILGLKGKANSEDLPNKKIVKPGTIIKSRFINEPVTTKTAQVSSKLVVPEPQVESVTALEPQSGSPIVGFGGARLGEVAVQGTPDVYGIRQETRESRAAAGKTTVVEPGKGISTPDSIEKGRQIIAQNPTAAETALNNFENDPNHAVSANAIAATRAHGEQLQLAANRAEEKFGTDSDEYRNAWQRMADWDARTKAMGTEWSKGGMAQQGETDIDTGSLTGLRRAFNDETGKDLTPEQQQRAKKVAAVSRKANDAEAAARKAVNEAITNAAAEVAKNETKERVRRAAIASKSGKTISDAEEKAIAAAHKTVREAAARMAEAESRTRVARTVRERDIAKVQEEAARKALAYANQVLREAAARRATEETKERVAKADLTTYLWSKAKDYIEAGVDDFDDLRNKLATDLGMKVEDVTAALGKSKRVKTLADDLWRKQQTARKLREQAKRWIKQTALPEYVRALQSVPRILFGLKVGFHGTVALGTHAPTVAFQPRFWKAYVTDFGKMYKMVGSPTYYEMQVQDLMRRPNYITARRAGLINDPFQYEDYNSPDTSKYFGNLTGMGNRGYSVLKILRQDMFDQRWNSLPDSTKIPAVAKVIAKGVNHATGVVEARAPIGANIIAFAPRLELSRVAWLVVDPIKAADTFLRWDNATVEQKEFAINQLKEKAWVLGTLYGLLALNQGFLSSTGSKQKINGIPESMGGAGFDPTRSDFMKFKASGMDLAYGNAMLSMARLPVRLFSIWSGTGGKLRSVVFPDESTYSVLGEYGRSQLSPFASLATTLLFKADWQNRPLPSSDRPVPKRLRAQGVQPYTWPEFWSEQVMPIPAEEAAREVWKTGLGMSPEEIKAMRQAMATIAIMAGTGARLTTDVRGNENTQTAKVTQ